MCRPKLDDAKRAELEADLKAAQDRYSADPASEDAVIWVGRRYAYLGHYRRSTFFYSQGLEQHPKSAKLLRHRGHRYITLRAFEMAEEDLERASRLIRGTPDEVEPDGAPNAQNIPRSTLHSNIWYHLGLAHYLQGENGASAAAFRSCLKVASNDDTRVAATHWLYLSLRRCGRPKEAAAVLEPIRADMEILENDDYHRLCLMYKGVRTIAENDAVSPDGTPGSAGLRYGVAAYLMLEGRPDDGRQRLHEIMATTNWAAFGHIAAEADLARKEP